MSHDTEDVFVHAKLIRKSYTHDSVEENYFSITFFDSLFSIRNLEASNNTNERQTITGAGFQFLLMNRRAQVWFFIINLLETRQAFIS